MLSVGLALELGLVLVFGLLLEHFVFRVGAMVRVNIKMNPKVCIKCILV